MRSLEASPNLQVIVRALSSAGYTIQFSNHFIVDLQRLATLSFNIDYVVGNE